MMKFFHLFFIIFLVLPINVGGFSPVYVETQTPVNLTNMSDYKPLQNFLWNDGIYEIDDEMEKLCDTFKNETLEGTIDNTLRHISSNYEYNRVDLIQTRGAVTIFHKKDEEMVCAEYTTLAIAMLRANNVSCTEMLKFNTTIGEWHAFVGIWNGSNWVQYEPQTGEIVNYMEEW